MVFILMSAVGMFGVLTAEAKRFDAAPRWLVFITTIMMFFNAGIGVGLMDSGFNDYRESWWLVYLQGLALVSIPLILTLVINWAAFGPGERKFSMSISIPFIAIDFDRANEIIGRIAFGIPALILDAALLSVMFRLIVETIQKNKDETESDVN